jgi:TPP-dependent pyruvate/acetoin dehydrogenase alpha subunit
VQADAATAQITIDLSRRPLTTRMPTPKQKQKDSHTFSLISQRRLLELYAGLVRCQILEQQLASGAAGLRIRARQGAAAPAVALVVALRAGDAIATSPSDLLPAFVRSQRKLQAFLAALMSAEPRPAFTAQLKSALAAAREHRRSNSGNIAVIFADGTQTAGAAWRNALAAAARERLPILFVSRSEPESAGDKAHASLGFPAINGDCNDVVAIYRVASEAMAHARRGNGATLIRCFEWPASLAENCATSDPVANMERYLAASSISASRTRTAAIAQLRRNFEAALALSRRSPRRSQHSGR